MPRSHDRNGFGSHGHHGYDDRRSHDRYHGSSRRHHDRRSLGSGRSDEFSRRPPNWSWIPSVFSFISMTIFASWCGIVAVFCSALSYSDHKAGDYRRAKYKRWWVWLCAISGIVFTVVCIVFLFLVMYVFDIPRPTFQDARYWIPPWLYRELGNNTQT